VPHCELAPQDKAQLGRQLGSRLAKTYGKKRFYTTSQVGESLRSIGSKIDVHCWGYALFCSPGDFLDYHASLSESCDYAAMKSEMVSAVTDGASDSWFAFDLSWLEWPDIDLGSIFDF